MTSASGVSARPAAAYRLASAWVRAAPHDGSWRVGISGSVWRDGWRHLHGIVLRDDGSIRADGAVSPAARERLAPRLRELGGLATATARAVSSRLAETEPGRPLNTLDLAPGLSLECYIGEGDVRGANWLRLRWSSRGLEVLSAGWTPAPELVGRLERALEPIVRAAIEESRRILPIEGEF